MSELLEAVLNRYRTVKDSWNIVIYTCIQPAGDWPSHIVTSWYSAVKILHWKLQKRLEMITKMGGKNINHMRFSEAVSIRNIKWSYEVKKDVLLTYCECPLCAPPTIIRRRFMRSRFIFSSHPTQRIFYNKLFDIILHLPKVYWMTMTSCVYFCDVHANF